MSLLADDVLTALFAPGAAWSSPRRGDMAGLFAQRLGDRRREEQLALLGRWHALPGDRRPLPFQRRPATTARQAHDSGTADWPDLQAGRKPSASIAHQRATRRGTERLGAAPMAASRSVASELVRAVPKAGGGGWMAAGIAPRLPGAASVAAAAMGAGGSAGAPAGATAALVPTSGRLAGAVTRGLPDRVAGPVEASTSGRAEAIAALAGVRAAPAAPASWSPLPDADPGPVVPSWVRPLDQAGRPPAVTPDGLRAMRVAAEAAPGRSRVLPGALPGVVPVAALAMQAACSAMAPAAGGVSGSDGAAAGSAVPVIRQQGGAAGDRLSGPRTRVPNAGAPPAGRPAQAGGTSADRAESLDGPAVQVGGEVALSARRLGQMTERAQVRQAGLPPSGQSRVSVRSASIYSGMRIPQ